MPAGDGELCWLTGWPLLTVGFAARPRGSLGKYLNGRLVCGLLIIRCFYDCPRGSFMGDC